MNEKEFDNVYLLHQKWLNKEDGGVRADLSGLDLRGMDMRWKNLEQAILGSTNLGVANLENVNLSGANLRYANLTGVNLRCANLCDADMYHVDLTGADLRWTNMEGADLSFADISGADLFGANLRDANIAGVKHHPGTVFFSLQCPEKGAFIAYKKVSNLIVELEVPADAMRSSATTRKCRCSKAKVLGFYNHDRNELPVEEVINYNYGYTIYHKGLMVYPDKWDDNRWNECSNGIHFFLTFEEAKNYK